MTKNEMNELKKIGFNTNTHTVNTTVPGSIIHEFSNVKMDIFSLFDNYFLKNT